MKLAGGREGGEGREGGIKKEGIKKGGRRDGWIRGN